MHRRASLTGSVPRDIGHNCKEFVLISYRVYEQTDLPISQE